MKKYDKKGLGSNLYLSGFQCIEIFYVVIGVLLHNVLIDFVCSLFAHRSDQIPLIFIIVAVVPIVLLGRKIIQNIKDNITRIIPSLDRWHTIKFIVERSLGIMVVFGLSETLNIFYSYAGL